MSTGKSADFYVPGLRRRQTLSKPVNLNKARKARERAMAEQKAKENQARFGRTRAEKSADETRTEKSRRDIDQKRLDPGETQGDG